MSSLLAKTVQINSFSLVFIHPSMAAKVVMDAKCAKSSVCTSYYINLHKTYSSFFI